MKESNILDFGKNFILDRASNDLKLQIKRNVIIEIKLNPSINRQMNSELFSFFHYATKDVQKHLNTNKNSKRS